LNLFFCVGRGGRIRAGGRFMASLQPQSAGKASAASPRY
jgi:hypothetical protein